MGVRFVVKWLVSKVFHFVKGLLLLAVICLLVVGCVALLPSDDDSEDFVEDDDADVSENQEPSEQELNDIYYNMVIDVHDLKFENETDIIMHFEDQFDIFAVVEYDSDMKLFKIIPAQIDFVAVLGEMVEGRLVDEADSIRTYLTNISSLIEFQLGQGYTIALTNPVDPDNGIFIVRDGVVITDYLY